jgi:ATP/maltotriose-dependent transcriptional regulator MalT
VGPAAGGGREAITTALGLRARPRATVKNHMHNILQKLHVSRRGQAAARRYPHAVD